MDSLTLKPGHLGLAELRLFARGPVPVRVAESVWTDIDTAARTVQAVIAEGRTVYGINTGFGLLANKRIAPDELEALQRSIVLSHAAGTGEPLPESSTRLVMLLKLNSLGRGYSGVSRGVFTALLDLLNSPVYPCIPCQGSVGASGDLAPLAHMTTVLLGEGEAFHAGERVPARRALAIAGIAPQTLGPKEGLSLLNGTQVSTALALEGLFGAERALCAAIAIGALAVEAARGSRAPFDARIHAASGHPAQIDVARAYHALLSHSQIEESHRNCRKVQDPYSLRCQPQVMGACLQQLRNAARTLLTEANGVSDNPLVFAAEGEIVSGGNFHAEQVAMAADGIALALAEIGALAERRIALLIDSDLSGLPPFLVDNGGLNSGFMIAQVTAAALASENKSLAHPASVDSLPTSANQEDHVSMAAFAARRLRAMVANTTAILAIEWLATCQGLDFLQPLRTSATLEQARERLRAEVPFYDRDRYFAPDIERATALLRGGVLDGFAGPFIGLDAG
jgi:histidine ammonia-lyase